MPVADRVFWAVEVGVDGSFDRRRIDRVSDGSDRALERCVALERSVGLDIGRQTGLRPMTTALPEGFGLSDRTSLLRDLVGSFAVATYAGGTVLGMWAEDRHSNSRSAVHGAVLSALADKVMGRNAAAATTPRSLLLTVTLSIDFIAAARAGQRLEATATVQRTGRRLAFAQGRIYANGTLIAQSSGTLAVVSSA